MIATGYRLVSSFLVVILFTSLCSAVCPESRHQTTIAAYALSPDAKRVAALSADGTLSKWDVASGKRTQLQECINHEFSRHPILFSPDSSNLAVEAGNGVEVFSMATEKVIAELDSPHLRDVIDMVFSADGKRLAASDGQHIVLWQMENQSEITSISEISDRNALALNADGTILAFSARNGIALWDVATSSIFRTLSLPKNTDAESLLFIDSQGQTRLLQQHLLAAAIATAVAPKPGDRLRKFTREAAIWDVNSAKKLKTLKGHFNELSSPISTGGNTLFAMDEELHAWNIKTGNRQSIGIISEGFVSGDGRFLLRTSKEPGSLALWQIDSTPQKIRTFTYRSPLCAEEFVSATDVQKAGLDGLLIADGYVDNGSIGSYSVYLSVAKDCTPVRSARSTYASEKRARQVLQQRMASAAEVLQNPNHDLPMRTASTEPALVRFPDDLNYSGGVAIMWTEGRTLYEISSSSLPVALAMESEMLSTQKKSTASDAKP